jgi:hypothetical protein
MGMTTKQPTLTKADLIEEVLRITELPRKESETVVETIFESIIHSRIRKLSYAATAWKNWTQSKNGRESGCAAEENSLF